MFKKKILTATVGVVGTALLLSGCAFMGGGSDDGKTIDKPSATQPSKDNTPAPDSDDDSDAQPSGEITEPGSKLELNEWATYEYTGLDGQKAIISSRLVGVEDATEAQKTVLVEKIPDLADYDVFLFTTEEKKISGDPIVFEADYTDYSVASADGARAQEVTVIGWDECKSESFTKEFDEDGATITQCFVGAVKPGGAVPTGLIYAPYDGVYDYADGEPIYFSK